MFPNDEVVAYGRANGLGSDYNDIMTAFLRDYYSSNLSLTDLWGRAWAEGYRSINGFTDFPGIANSEFYAPLTHSLVLTRGTGSATFTRATKAWEFGYSAAANSGDSQVLMEIASGTPRFGGARYDAGTWYSTYADGSTISASSLLGYHAEGARTNSLLYSRDLTNAAWAATNITPAKTATGLDNAANSASTLTAGAADATILQTLTLAAAARSFSAYVKRRTGSGNIYITRDGGTSWTDVTSQINSSTWTRVKIENTSVLNPQVGFKIATSGDAIDVDVCQDEAGAFASSPIITTTAAVTRNADSLTYANNLPQSAGSWVFSGYTTVPYNVGVDSTFIGAAQGKQYLGTENARTALTVTDGTKYPTQPGLTRLTTGGGKYGASWGGSALRSAGEGSVASGNFDGTFGLSTTLGIGDQATTGQPIFGHIKDVYVWQYALTAAQLAQVTA